MAGPTRNVKRQWSIQPNLSDNAPEDAFLVMFEEHNKVIADLAAILAFLNKPLDSVVNVEFVATASCDLAVDDGDDADLETNRDVVASYRGQLFTVLTDAAIDVSAILGTGKTIGSDQFGVIWVFGNKTADVALAVPAAAQTELTDIAALAQNMPNVPTEGDVPIACLMIEADTSVWEWGHTTDGEIGPDSDTETYYNLLNLPYITSAMASFALDAAASTFTYGAAVAVLGTGVALTITGKANVAFPAGERTVIVTGKTGAYILYALADDDEIPVQIGAAFADITVARAAVDALNTNPLLIELGRIYITNDSGTNFTPATTNLDTTGITVVFETAAVASRFLSAVTLTAATIATVESQD